MRENAKNIVDQVKSLNKPITNADRIRAMTDEELAMAMPFPQCPPHKGECMFSTMIANSCDQCWLDWLRQEVKE